MSPERSNGLTEKELKQLQIVYENATPEERRAMEIRDLGYPITPNPKTPPSQYEIINKDRFHFMTDEERIRRYDEDVRIVSEVKKAQRQKEIELYGQPFKNEPGYAKPGDGC